jgi:hypothetical protein
MSIAGVSAIQPWCFYCMYLLFCYSVACICSLLQIALLIIVMIVAGVSAIQPWCFYCMYLLFGYSVACICSLLLLLFIMLVFVLFVLPLQAISNRYVTT